MVSYKQNSSSARRRPLPEPEALAKENAELKVALRATQGQLQTSERALAAARVEVGEVRAQLQRCENERDTARAAAASAVSPY